LAQQFKAATHRGEASGLTEAELAFYDALRAIAQELVAAVRSSVTIDWTVTASVRAQLRWLARCLRRHPGYPPHQVERAIAIVLEQAELIATDWAGWGGASVWRGATPRSFHCRQPACFVVRAKRQWSDLSKWPTVGQAGRERTTVATAGRVRTSLAGWLAGLASSAI